MLYRPPGVWLYVCTCTLSLWLEAKHITYPGIVINSINQPCQLCPQNSIRSHLWIDRTGNVSLEDDYSLQYSVVRLSVTVTPYRFWSNTEDSAAIKRNTNKFIKSPPGQVEGIFFRSTLRGWSSELTQMGLIKIIKEKKKDKRQKRKEAGKCGIFPLVFNSYMTMQGLLPVHNIIAPLLFYLERCFQFIQISTAMSLFYRIGRNIPWRVN